MLALGTPFLSRAKFCTCHCWVSFTFFIYYSLAYPRNICGSDASSYLCNRVLLRYCLEFVMTWMWTVKTFLIISCLQSVTVRVLKNLLSYSFENLYNIFQIIPSLFLHLSFDFLQHPCKCWLKCMLCSHIHNYPVLASIWYFLVGEFWTKFLYSLPGKKLLCPLSVCFLKSGTVHNYTNDHGDALIGFSIS